MKRYLLFDSGCAVCSGLAHDIVQESGGKLEAHSLRSCNIQKILNDAKPDWRWEPMVVEINRGRVRVCSGVNMAVYLLKNLGLARTWRVARLVRQANASVYQINIERRNALKSISAVTSAIALTALGFKYSLAQEGGATTYLPLVQTNGNAVNSASFNGEVFAGFVLLPENAPIPAFVEDYKHGVPHMCGAHDSTQSVDASSVDSAVVNEPHTLNLEVSDAVALSLEAKAPAYIVSGLDDSLLSPNISIVKHADGQLWGSWTVYESKRPKGNHPHQPVSILAQYDFPKPMPLWASASPEKGVPSVILEKISVTPDKDGVLIRGIDGYTLHWIDESVYYTLTVDSAPEIDVSVIQESLQRVVR